MDSDNKDADYYDGLPFVKIDESFLPKNIEELKNKGIRVEFYPDGQLKKYGYYTKSGAAVMELSLEPNEKVAISGNKEQYDRYMHGASERIDVWSDNSQPQPCDWTIWIQKEIKMITEYALD